MKYPLTINDYTAAYNVLSASGNLTEAELAIDTSRPAHPMVLAFAAHRQQGAEPLVSALGRIEHNFNTLLRGNPVRDMAETEAEINMALAPYREVVS